MGGSRFCNEKLHLFSVPALFADHPILAAWRKTIARRPSAAAIFGADGTVLRTFRDIEDESPQLPQGLAPGQIAVIELGNHPALPATLLALWKEGLAVALAESSVALPGVALRVALGASGAPVFYKIDAPAEEIPGADFLKLTSGTTGAPRAIRFSAAQLLADCDAVCDTMGITEADLNYGVISWAHSYGFSNLVLPLLCRGVPVVATEDRLPRAILDGLARTGATVFPAVPVFFKKLAELAATPLPALRLCISAGAPLPSAVATDFRQRFGVKVHSFYGSSECGGICYDATGDEVPEGFVGQPMRGVRLVENAGRIVIYSPAAGLGYWPQPDDAVLGNGRFIPQDLVEQTERGFSLRGRESDFINIAGRKLNPAEIERVLREHPAVREVVVFGMPSALRGEEPAACVVADASTQELLAFAATRLPAWQMLRQIWLVAALPVNERGKLSRRAVAEHFGQQSKTEPVVAKNTPVT